MQTWTQRGLQAVLVTGGLLMLGTGIASATENVNPDQAPGPLDVSVDMPVHVQDNVLATPLGDLRTPTVDRDLRLPPVSAAPSAPAHPYGRHALRTAATQGNHLQAHLTAPVQLCGNVAALGRHAAVDGSCDQHVLHTGDLSTGGAAPLSGNVAKTDADVPVQVTGNAFGAFGGRARSTYTATQYTDSAGDLSTGGARTALSGNAVAASPAVPVGLDGVAGGALLGDATTRSTTASVTHGDGALRTDGSGAFGGGNAVGFAPGVPVEVGDTAMALGGTATAGAGTGRHYTDVTSGSPNPAYVGTSGHGGVLSGMAAAQDIATPMGVCGVSGGALAGTGAAHCASRVDDKAGGATVTDGRNSVLGGTAAHLPVAMPMQVGGLAVTGGGVASGDGVTESNVNAGRAGTRTQGDASAFGGNVLSTPLAGSADLCGVTGAYLGAASATCTDSTVARGGADDVSTGGKAAGSGNVVAAPVALPAAVLGSGGALGGASTAKATGHQDVLAGGETDSGDDNGFAAANIVDVPASVPAQLFGVSGAGFGAGRAAATHTTASTAGGLGLTRGSGGAGSGNVVSAPVAGPLQMFGVAGQAFGAGSGTADGTTRSTAGGATSVAGDRGQLAGNVVTAPMGLGGQAFGDAFGGFGAARASGTNTTDTAAGGSTLAEGSGGGLAGNVVAAPVDPLAHLFGMGGGLAAPSSGRGVNDAQSTVGGPVTASSTRGGLAGNVVSAPVQGLAQGFGDAAAAFGGSRGDAVNAVDAANGGPVSTDGTGGVLSGNGVLAPVQGAGRMFGDTSGAFGATPVASGVDGTQATNGAPASGRGTGGAGSGNVLGVPVQGAAAPFASGAGFLGGAGTATGKDSAITSNGGSAVAPSAPSGALTGLTGQLPVGLGTQFFRAELPAFASLLTEGVHTNRVTDGGEQTPVVDLPGDPGTLPGIGDLPSLPTASALPRLGMPSLPTTAPRALAAPVALAAAPAALAPRPAPVAAPQQATFRSAPAQASHAADTRAAAAPTPAPAPGPGLPTDNLGVLTGVVSDIAVPVMDTTGTLRGEIPIGPDGPALPDLAKLTSGAELTKIDLPGKVNAIVAGTEHAVARVTALVPTSGTSGTPGTGSGLPLPGLGGGSGLPLPGVGGGSGLPLPDLGGLGVPGLGGSGKPAPGGGSGLPLPGLGGGSGLPLPGVGGGSGLPLPDLGGLGVPGLGGSGKPAPGGGSGLPLPGLGGGSGLPLPGVGGGSGLPLPDLGGLGVPGLGGSGKPAPGGGSGLPLPGLGGGSGLPLPGLGGGSGLPVLGLNGSGLPVPGLGGKSAGHAPALADLDSAGNGIPAANPNR